MKAIRINEWGKPVQLEDVPMPVPADDEVLVRVHAASINPFDVAIAAGFISYMTSTPMTAGTDYAGEVVQTGKSVKHVKPGDEVYGMAVLHSGTFAEYATPKGHEVAHKPRSLDFIQASAIPLAATAAWQTLFDSLQIKSGERLLIQGVGGSVGTYALQFAKSAGVFVYGTDIPERAEVVKSLGIDHYINHKTERFQDVVQNVDAVLDLVAGALIEQSYDVLKPGGRYVTTLAMDTPQEEPTRRGIRSLGFAAQPKTELLNKFAELVDNGDLKVIFNRTFPLAQAQEAMIFRGTTTVPGKVVLTIK